MTVAGKVVVDFSAGTAQAIIDIEKYKAKIREVGTANVSSLQASSAALRELEGNFGHNIRAVENFLAKVLGLGNVLKAAFPIVGGLAFAGLMVDLGKKLDDFVEHWQQAPERMSGAFNQINLRLRTTNDELDLSNARLANEIAKLEGKPQNGLAEALLDARVQADKLAESLAADLDAFGKLLKAEHDNPVVGYFKGEANDADIHNRLVGKSGFGGLRAMLADADTKPEDKIAAINKALADNKTAFDAATSAQKDYKHASDLFGGTGGENGKAEGPLEAFSAIPKLLTTSDQSKRLEELAEEKRYLDGMLARVQKTETNQALVAERDKLRADRANAKIERPVDNAIRALESQLRADVAKGNAASGSPLERATAAGNAAADVKIEAVRKALEKTHGTLSALQVAQIRSLEIGKALRTMETEWEGQQRQFSLSLDTRTAAQKRLTGAVGQGYESMKAAVVENQLQAAMGERYNNPAYRGEQDANRSKIAAAFEADHARQITVTVDKLGDEITLTKSLTAAQEQGAAVVRLAAEAFREQQAAKEGASPEEVARMRQKFEADEALASAEAAVKIRQETDAIKARTAAVMEGADTQRRAANEVKYGQMSAAGASPDQVSAERAKDAAEYQAEIAEGATKAGRAYVDGMNALNQQLAFLMAVKKTQGDSLALEVSMRAIENERLHLVAQYTLEQRRAMDGVRAFFTDMKAEAESSAHIIYDTLHRAFDEVAHNMADMITSGKADWGKMFKDLGNQALESTFKSVMQKGLGAIGSYFGISGQAPDGSQNNPFYVVSAELGGQLGNQVYGSGMAGMLSKLGGFGSTDEGEGGGFWQSLAGAFLHFGGGRASGGFTSPNSAYIVGEEGPELMSRQSGYVTRSTELSRMMAGNNGGPTYQIDARGTDPALTEARVKRAIAQSHNSSVGTAVRVNEEKMKRTPQR